MQIGREGVHHLRRVPLGVDRDENRFHHQSAPFENVDRLCIARRIQRADIRTEGIAEINQGGLVNHLGLSHRGPCFINKGEGSTNLRGAPGDRRADLSLTCNGTKAHIWVIVN